MSQATVFAFLFLGILAPDGARGQVTLSSPVEGYCRIGKYTPVQVSIGQPGAAEVVIEADGAPCVRLNASAGTKVVVPILVLARPNGSVAIHSSAGSQSISLPFQVLSDDERLIGLTGGAGVEDVRHLYPGKRLIPIKLDPARPLPGAQAAWEVLDAIVFDVGPRPAGIDDAAIRILLGGGIALAVRSAQPPDDRWPWARQGDCWILHHNLLGPATAFSDSAYLPVRGWPSEGKWRSRVMIVGVGIPVVLGVLALLKPRRRLIKWGGLTLAATALVGVVAVWLKPEPPQHVASGTIASFGSGLLQHDFWEYRAPAAADGAVSCECIVDTRQPRDRWARVAAHPVLTSASQAFGQKLTLRVDGKGEPQEWTARPGAGEKIAFVTRMVDPFSSKKYSLYTTTVDSPLEPLVRAAYASQGVRVTGQGFPRTDTKNGFAEIFLESNR